MSECTCEYCVNACKQTPGWFAPGEGEKVAEYLKLSFEEFVKTYCIWDYWVGEDLEILSPFKIIKEIVNLSPFIEPDKPGGHASWGYPLHHGDCVFLKNNRCIIHPVKPYECRAVNACDKSDKTNYRETIMKKWKREKVTHVAENKEYAKR